MADFDDQQTLSPRMAEPVLPAAAGESLEVAATLVEVLETPPPVGEIPAAQTERDEDANEEGRPVRTESLALVAGASQEDPELGPSVPEDLDFDALQLQWDAKCKKCWQPVMPQDAVVKAPRVLWCKECNTLYSMVKRHQAWPPPCFQGLTSEQQAAFWSKCKGQQRLFVYSSP